MLGTGEILGIEALPFQSVRKLLVLLGHHFNDREPIATFERRAQGIGETLLDALPGHQAIHHHLNAVQVVLVELDVVGKLAHLAIDANPGESLSGEAADQFAVGAFLAAHHGGKQLIAGALRQRADLIHHLVDGLGADRPIALRAVGIAGATEQQTQIILDLRHRAHRGAWVVAGGFLVDGDGRRQAFDGIDIRFVDLPQKLPRVGGEALHVTALALSEDRVEGQGALAAAADPREHHHLVAWDGDVHVLEVVLTGTPHPDHVLEGPPAQVHGFLGRRALRLGGGRTHAALISSPRVYEDRAFSESGRVLIEQARRIGLRLAQVTPRQFREFRLSLLSVPQLGHS